MVPLRQGQDNGLLRMLTTGIALVYCTSRTLKTSFEAILVIVIETSVAYSPCQQLS